MGLIVGAGVAYWLVSPLFITRRADEKLEEIKKMEPPVSVEKEEAKKPADEFTAVAQGAFEGLAFHKAQGTAKLLKLGDSYFVRFEEDFSVTNGPDLFVYLGKDGQYDPEARLAALKGNVGGQNYAIPSNLLVSNYNEVWVWCRAFSVPFGKASLR